MRKSQAALEFLTTYGWAFLVILIMIGALAYFGILNPSKVLPSKCVVEAGFNCRDFVIYEDSFNINILNKKGEAIKNVNLVNASSEDFFDSTLDIDEATECSITPATVVRSDEEAVISCTHAGMFTGMAGEKIKIEFIVNYTMARGTYAKKFEGSVFGTVQ